MARKILKALLGIFAFGMLMLTIGIAGGIEQNLIEESFGFAGMLTSVSLFGASVILNKLI